MSCCRLNELCHQMSQSRPQTVKSWGCSNLGASAQPCEEVGWKSVIKIRRIISCNNNQWFFLLFFTCSPTLATGLKTNGKNGLEISKAFDLSVLIQGWIWCWMTPSWGCWCFDKNLKHDTNLNVESWWVKCACQEFHTWYLDDLRHLLTWF